MESTESASGNFESRRELAPEVLARSIQLGEGGRGYSRLALVEEFEDTYEARVVSEYEERLATDQALVYELQWEGFKGKGWDALAEALFTYGWMVIFAWIRNGRIIAKCRQARVRGVPDVPHWLWERLQADAEDITQATMIDALEHFREDVLKPGKWDASRGATLRTYFVGQALIRFSGVLRSWTRKQPPADLVITHKIEPAMVLSPDPADIVTGAAGVQGLLTQIPDGDTRKIFELLAEDYSYEEIAHEVGLSSRAVEGRIRRTRRRFTDGRP